MIKTSPRQMPPNLPVVGDRCRLRGRGFTGTVKEIATEPANWTRVVWDLSRGPIVCHLFELEKLSKEAISD